MVLLEYDNAVTLITIYISKLYVCLMFVVIKFTLGYYIKEIPYLMSQYTYEYRISSVIRHQSIFFLQNNPKNLHPSYKTDLDLWDCLGMVKLTGQTYIIAKFHRTGLVIFSHSREGKNLSHSRINSENKTSANV